MTTNINDRIAQYVKVRDLIKEMEADHKDAMRKPKDTLEKLGNVIMAMMDSLGAESVRSDSGTAYFSSKSSATIADGDAFMSFVIEKEEFDLIERRANVTAVRAYLDEHGSLPPGVNFSTIRTLGVRRD